MLWGQGQRIVLKQTVGIMDRFPFFWYGNVNFVTAVQKEVVKAYKLHYSFICYNLKTSIKSVYWTKSPYFPYTKSIDFEDIYFSQ